MATTSKDWPAKFTAIFHRAIPVYRAGHARADELFTPDESAFLSSIGYTGQEMFDFIEDHAKGGEPTAAEALAMAAVRRDYFLQVQKGRFAGRSISLEHLPSKEATVEGIAWLPRIIAKAEAKLRGEMGPHLMYGCGGDRRFFRANGVDGAALLREVWAADGDRQRVVAWVKRQHKALATAGNGTVAA